MPNSRSTYSLFLSGLGFILVFWSLFQIPSIEDLITFTLLLILAVLVQATMTHIIRETSGVSVETAISLAAIPIFGFHAAILIAAAAAFSAWALTLHIDSPPWRYALERLGVNIGMQSTSMFLAGMVFVWSDAGIDGSVILKDTVPWLLAAITADQVNLWLLIGIIYLVHGIKPLQTWQENLWAIPINVGVMAAGGGLLAFSVRTFGVLGIVGFFLPIALSAYAYRYIAWNAKKQMGELEELVALRTQALADANDELENLQKEKDSFLAVLTHDMRTPLTSIQGYATLLSSQQLENEQQMQMGKIILRNGETLLDIVNNMLEIEQMKAGMPVTLEYTRFDLARLAERTVEAIRSQAMEKDISLQCHTVESPVFVEGDEKKIERVLLNLTSNAIKYTPPEGCVEITARMNGRYAILEVSDNGYGIPEDEVDHIFDSYRRVKDHQHIALGTGLGLAIVKSLVEAHDGQIDVSSKVDVGSTFTVKLPLPAISD